MALRRARAARGHARRRRLLCAQRAGAGSRQDRRAGRARIDRRGRRARARWARQLAMHVAAANPLYLDIASVDPAALERERAVLREQARASGKPEAIVDKMVEGRLRKFYEEVVLLEQIFVDRRRDAGSARSSRPPPRMLGAPITRRRLRPLRPGRGDRAAAADFAAEVAAAAQALTALMPAVPGKDGATPRRMISRAQFDVDSGVSGRAVMPDDRQAACPADLKYRRVLLKLSGEALMGERDYGLDPDDRRRASPPRSKSVHASGRRDLPRHRRRQHLPRPVRRGGRHGARHGRLHGHAGDRHQFAGHAERAGAPRRRDPRAVGDLDAGGVRALYPPPRHPPSWKRAGW